jgi:hypothetical protein
MSALAGYRPGQTLAIGALVCRLAILRGNVASGAGMVGIRLLRGAGSSLVFAVRLRGQQR